MNIEYRHMKPDFTFAMRRLSHATVKAVVEVLTQGKGADLALEIGYTVVSSKDQYSRPHGRKLAEERLHHEQFYVDEVNIDESSISLRLSNKNLLLCLSSTPNNGSRIIWGLVKQEY